MISMAKVSKTPDELSAMREGLRITEQAIADVQAKIAPGVRQTDLTATFLRTIFEAGADANILDPIWQVMPARMADGPWTTTGDLACPLLSTERELVEGDVLWVDSGISYAGFHSDFGRGQLVYHFTELFVCLRFLQITWSSINTNRCMCGAMQRPERPLQLPFEERRGYRPRTHLAGGRCTSRGGYGEPFVLSIRGTNVIRVTSTAN